VVDTYDYGVDGGCAFIVMEYLKGEDLASRLEREGRLSVQAAGAIVAQICTALDAIHAAGVVHRDLKPANVFLVAEEAGELVKVVDFGIAKATAGIFDKLTESGMMLGTPKYMSPEQVIASKDVDYRADLWSTSVILFRMVTGFYPFVGSSTVDLVCRICQGKYFKASEVAPELPSGIDAFFMKAFARSPDRRFQSGRELASAFLAVFQGQTRGSVRPRPATLLPPVPASRAEMETVVQRVKRVVDRQRQSDESAPTQLRVASVEGARRSWHDPSGLTSTAVLPHAVQLPLRSVRLLFFLCLLVALTILASARFTHPSPEAGARRDHPAAVREVLLDEEAIRGDGAELAATALGGVK
jgi:serine/threonine protein kinase